MKKRIIIAAIAAAFLLRAHDVCAETYNGFEIECDDPVDLTVDGYSDGSIDPMTGESEDEITAFVRRMYEVVLGREAEEGGLNDWSGQLRNQTADGATLARGFICSEEFTKKNLPDDEYLRVLYKAFFDRDPDKGGFDGWKKSLGDGMSRNEVLCGFVNSKEFSILCDRFNIARGTMDADGTNIFNPGVRLFVERMYTKALKRDGETMGIENWAYRINKKEITPLDCALGFFNSDEFKNKKLNNEDYVETLYETFFDRPSDEGGKKDWVSKLNAGEDRNEVLEGFAASREFQIILAGFGLSELSADATRIPAGQPFVKGTLGSEFYRIPSIVSLDDGTIIASADARWNSRKDGGGSDTAVAVSTDMGNNWNASLVNYFGDNGDQYTAGSTAFLDSSLATDGNTVYLLTTLFPQGYSFWETTRTFPLSGTGFNSNGLVKLRKRGASDYSFFLQHGRVYNINGNPVKDYSVDSEFNLIGKYSTFNLFYVQSSPYSVYPTEYLWLRKSEDGGKTWSEPSLLNVKKDKEQGYGTGCGRGTILSDGTIMFPCYFTSEKIQRASFVYSTDGGETWMRSPDATGDGHDSSEASIIELNPGYIRMFYRDKFSELYYTDYVKNDNVWKVLGMGKMDTVRKGLHCQFNVIKYNDDTLLISSTGSGTEDRNTGMITTVKLDGNYKMSVANRCYVNHDKYFGYSCLTKLKDGSVGLLYENMVTDSECTLDFMRIPASDLGLN